MASDAPGWDAQVTFCYTREFEATTHFYESVLELPLALDQGACRIYRVRDGAFIGVCRRDRRPDSDGIILTLVSDDVDGWYARLQARGVAFEKPPAYNPKFNIYHCFLRDPNGYLIEIQRFDEVGVVRTAQNRLTDQCDPKWLRVRLGGGSVARAGGGGSGVWVAGSVAVDCVEDRGAVADRGDAGRDVERLYLLHAA